MLKIRVPRARRPLLESLESRTVATASHGFLIHPGLAHRVPHAAALAPSDAVGPIPLNAFGPGATYQGQEGGLYGAGSNQPSPALLDAALAASARIQPLNRRGRPAAGGRIGVMAIGQSTTKQWFPSFQVM